MTVSQPHTLQVAHSATPVMTDKELSDVLFVDLSHELRTPLTAIQGALELLGSGKLGTLSEQERRMVEIAASNANRLLRLTAAIEGELESQVSFLSADEMARLRLERDLEMALEQKEFKLHYQPIISLESSSIVGFEALLRWQHPYLGLIPPDEFIPLAEASGSIIEIGAWVLWEACRQLRSWQQRFPEAFRSLTVSVNLSSKQLALPDLVEHIGQVLQETGLSSQSLVLEITESAVVENSKTAKQALERIQNLGVRVYIDDFGTGYSSLSRLYELPLDVLKIDRSFVQQLNSQSGEHLVRAIVNLAHNLGMEVIAEGVEMVEQVMKLRLLGCNRVQGYFFAKPLSQDDLAELVCELPSNTLWQPVS
ncbi:diguanylate phosphodiesterase [Leptolyngbya sp. 'hensonii']|uniref:EAL domain-containing protein n=1 Tax=Leptolyngbya sp. 'hensonii' TaxID=1922337 RepID=UPI00094F73B0|nr:EAL domain-containing protein [Leptolyngbya sp. 'hensonii']OLP18045.1 diguanylate phosphodiesterase [Leptolyngbya sp. 'hensonii']